MIIICLAFQKLDFSPKVWEKKLSLVVANMCSLQVTLQVSFDVDAETASRLAITRIFIHFQEKHSIYLQGTTLDRFLIW